MNEENTAVVVFVVFTLFIVLAIRVFTVEDGKDLLFTRRRVLHHFAFWPVVWCVISCAALIGFMHAPRVPSAQISCPASAFEIAQLLAILGLLVAAVFQLFFLVILRCCELCADDDRNRAFDQDDIEACLSTVVLFAMTGSVLLYVAQAVLLTLSLYSPGCDDSVIVGLRALALLQAVTFGSCQVITISTLLSKRRSREHRGGCTWTSMTSYSMSTVNTFFFGCAAVAASISLNPDWDVLAACVVCAFFGLVIIEPVLTLCVRRCSGPALKGPEPNGYVTADCLLATFYELKCRFWMWIVEAIAAVVIIAVWASRIAASDTVQSEPLPDTRNGLGLTCLSLVVLHFLVAAPFAAYSLFGEVYRDSAEGRAERLKQEQLKRQKQQQREDAARRAEWLSSAFEEALASQKSVFELAAATVPWVRAHNVTSSAVTNDLWQRFLTAPNRADAAQLLLMIRESLWRNSISELNSTEMAARRDLQLLSAPLRQVRSLVDAVAEHAARVFALYMQNFLTVRKFGDPALEDQRSCLICNRVFHERQDITETPCGHAFCSEPCAHNWFLDGRHRCPTCGVDVVSPHGQIDIFTAAALSRFAVASNMLETGGSAVVYRSPGVAHRGVLRDVALKVFTAGAAHLINHELRFSLRHEHVLSVIGVCRDPELPCVVLPLLTPLVNGSRLPLSAIQHLSLEQRILVCRDIAAALEFIHSRGKTHRDVKPHNVLLRQEPRSQSNEPAAAQASNTLRAVLADLGSMRTAHSHTVGLIMTPVFVAPEVQRAHLNEIRLTSKEYLAADIFSAGRTFICILLDRLPIDSAAMRQHTEQLPQLLPSQPQLVTLINAMTDATPTQRPIARLVLHALNLLAGMPNVSNRSEEELQCEFCCSAPRNVAFITCGHHVACSSCAKKMPRQECPLCRTTISSVIPCNPEAPVFVGSWLSLRNGSHNAQEAAANSVAQQQQAQRHGQSSPLPPGLVDELELAMLDLSPAEVELQQALAAQLFSPTHRDFTAVSMPVSN